MKNLKLMGLSALILIHFYSENGMAGLCPFLPQISNTSIVSHLTFVNQRRQTSLFDCTPRFLKELNQFDYEKVEAQLSQWDKFIYDYIKEVDDTFRPQWNDSYFSLRALREEFRVMSRSKNAYIQELLRSNLRLICSRSEDTSKPPTIQGAILFQADPVHPIEKVDSNGDMVAPPFLHVRLLMTNPQNLPFARADRARTLYHPQAVAGVGRFALERLAQRVSRERDLGGRYDLSSVASAAGFYSKAMKLNRTSGGIGEHGFHYDPALTLLKLQGSP